MSSKKLSASSTKMETVCSFDPLFSLCLMVIISLCRIDWKSYTLKVCACMFLASSGLFLSDIRWISAYIMLQLFLCDAVKMKMLIPSVVYTINMQVSSWKSSSRCGLFLGLERVHARELVKVQKFNLMEHRSLLL